MPSKGNKPANHDYRRREQRSVAQFIDQAYAAGFSVHNPQVDNGQDLTLEIQKLDRTNSDFDSTGLLFHVQLKATESLDSFANRQRTHIEYKIAVKNFQQWEYYPTPVVVVIWDITLQEGRWSLVTDLLADLNKRRSNWRNKASGSKIKVRIPLENTTDKTGFINLRRRLGDIFIPQALATRPLAGGKFKVTIPASDTTMIESFKRHIAEGTAIHLKKPYVTDFRLPDIAHDLLWSDDLELTELFIYPIEQPDYLLHATLEIETNTGSQAKFANLEFKKVQVGTELHTISNKHQPSAVFFTIQLPSPEEAERLNSQGISLSLTLSYTFRSIGGNVADTQNNLVLFKLRQQGGIVRLTLHDHDDMEVTIPFGPTTKPLPFSPLTQDFYEFVDHLCIIQRYTKVRLRLPDDDTSIDAEVYLLAKRLAILIEKRETAVDVGKCRLSFIITSNEIEHFINESISIVEKGDTLTFGVQSSEPVELLGKSIVLNELEIVASGVFDGGYEQYVKLVRNHDYSQPLVLYLKGTTITYRLLYGGVNIAL